MHDPITYKEYSDRHLEEIYVTGVPAAVRKRYEEECALIASRGLEPFFQTIFELILEIRSREMPFSLRGYSANSLVLYLCGASHINPAEADLPSIFFFGSGTEQKPVSYNINLPGMSRYAVLYNLLQNKMPAPVHENAWYIELPLRAVFPETPDEYVIKERFSKSGSLIQTIEIRDASSSSRHTDGMPVIRLFQQKEADILYGLRRKTGTAIPEHPENNSEVFSCFHSDPPDLEGLGYIDSPPFRPLFESIRPHSLPELSAATGLFFEGCGFYDCQRELIRCGKLSLSETVYSRECVYRQLISRGMDEAEAFELVRDGRISEAGIKKAEELGLPEWMIETMENAITFLPEGQLLEYGRVTLCLAYFK